MNSLHVELSKLFCLLLFTIVVACFRKQLQPTPPRTPHFTLTSSITSVKTPEGPTFEADLEETCAQDPVRQQNTSNRCAAGARTILSTGISIAGHNWL